MKSEIILEGKKVGRLRASWLLLVESFRFLRADFELVLVPVVTTIILVFLFALLLLIVLVLGGIDVTNTESAATVSNFLFVFAAYIISAFTVALAQAAVTHTVAVRSQGGNATLGQSFMTAFKHAPALIVWSVVTSTVGIILRKVSEQSALIGRFIASLVGAAWSIATYFVVPAIVLHNKSALKAIPHSTLLFRQIWGETVVTNISIGLAFLVAHVVAIFILVGVLMLSLSYDLQPLFMVTALLWIVWLFASLLLQSVLNSIIKTLLYIYATSEAPPTNFNAELLGQILARTSSNTPGKVVTVEADLDESIATESTVDEKDVAITTPDTKIS